MSVSGKSVELLAPTELRLSAIISVIGDLSSEEVMYNAPMIVWIGMTIDLFWMPRSLEAVELI